ncbi:MAG: sensor domain-containing diguanylate cyclase, partial [Planctomycetes bacterium]|nr:sensor domain-containing diguanylate cyclase [Planctomycetota bacterium]
ADLGDLSERISRELEERALEISLVGEVIEKIRRMTDVDEIVRTFLGSCRNRLSFDRVFWFEADGERRLRLAYVLDKAGLRQPRQEGTLSLDESPDAGPIETAAITGKPFLASVDGEPGRDEWAKGARELGGAPLATSDQLLGVVVVDNSLTGSPLTEMSVQTLHLLAIEVALVIEKSHLLARWRQTERLARTDELTGLANRRQALAAIEAEIAKSRERGHSLALVLADLDNFKEYNDRFGHEAGDRILVGVAERIGKRSRGDDTVARLGGDEYVVVLPRASIEEARRFARRILQDVEAYGQELQTEFPGGALSLSAGVALFDPEADDGRTLLKRADEALYRAKTQGKGRIE